MRGQAKKKKKMAPQYARGEALLPVRVLSVGAHRERESRSALDVAAISLVTAPPAQEATEITP
jgi:hypothetical protein